MKLSNICIRRPVFTWVLAAVPVVLGLAAYFQLGVDLFPKIDIPVVAVSTRVPGLGAEEMETDVTRPVEEAVNTISGVDSLTSTIREGSSLTVVSFKLEKDGDVAAQEVRDRIAGVVSRLPEGAEPPVISKFDLDAAPILTIAVAGSGDLRQTTEIARRQIRDALQTVPGVGAVSLLGGRTRAVNVVVDPDRLASYGLSVEDVRRALEAQNVEAPGGVVQQGPRELAVRTLGRVTTPDGFNDLIVAEHDGRPVRIRDVGHAEDSVEEPRSLARWDGADAVRLAVQKQSGSNTVRVSDGVRQRLAEIAATLPAGVHTEIIQDQSTFIRSSIEEVRFHLLLAAVLVSLTILVFIRDWRTTLIATLAIPTSIIPTFLFMQVMGYTLNNITMLGLIMAIGIVIDDAVVVHENIFRRMEEDGLDPKQAARQGTKEIALAVMATSLSLVVIFVPVAFMGGIIGRFFSSFGLTVAFAVVMSLIVSFTLTPMLCAHFLKAVPVGAGHAGSKSGLVYRAVDAVYGKALRWALRHRFTVVGLCLLVSLASGPIALATGFTFIPRDDQSEFEVHFIAPAGSTLDGTNQLVTEVEQRLRKLPGVTDTFVVIGEDNAAKGQGDVTRGSIYLRLKDLGERRYTQFDVMSRARDMLKAFPELRTSVEVVQAIQGKDENRDLQIALVGPDLGKLSEYAEALKDRLKQTPGFVDVDTSMTLRQPEVQVSIDRDRAGDLGVAVSDVASTLNVLVGGSPVSRYQEGGEEYDVWLRADGRFRDSTEALENLTVPSAHGGLVRLDAVAKAEEAHGPSQINRLNGQRVVRVLAEPDGIATTEAMARTQDFVRDLNLPPGYGVADDGTAKTLKEMLVNFLVALGLSVLLMYLILAAQFESWLQPISILAALPVTVPFGLLSLLMFHQPIDLYALFGMFMLIGIVKKNGILQIDKTNELRRAGMDRDAAILAANHTRLRPILMTTLMLAAAMIPIALGSGPGAGARASMAKVIIGGQMLSLVLALLVTPVTYSLFDDLGRLFRRLFGWLTGGARPAPAPAGNA